jgi:hypothetical protein
MGFRVLANFAKIVKDIPNGRKWRAGPEWHRPDCLRPSLEAWWPESTAGPAEISDADQGENDCISEHYQ